jgi:hypothetical protein
MVTADTIEERLLDLLGAKSALALATLDLNSDTDFVEMTSGIDALKNRLEILLGKKPDKPIYQEPSPEREKANVERRERLMEAGGKLLTSVLEFFGELAPMNAMATPEEGKELPPNTASEAQASDEATLGSSKSTRVGETIKDFLKSAIKKDEDGKTHIVLPLPDDEVIDKISEGISKFLGKFF